MRKKRILFCSEATFLNTGYATYTREILNYLYSTGKYEIAEMAAYGEKNDPRAANIPWKYYGVMPNQNSEPKKLSKLQFFNLIKALELISRDLNAQIGNFRNSLSYFFAKIS